MDEAAMRRFHIKVRFDPLTDDGKERIFRAYFLGKKEKFSTNIKKKVRAIEGLTPGDFKAVKQSMSYSKENSMSHDDIIRELTKEAGYRMTRKRAAGF
jgi:MoxR-like ATPase